MKNLITLFTILSFLYSVNCMAQDSNPVKSVKKVIVSSGILLEIERSDEYTLDINSPDLDLSCLINSIEDSVLTLKISSSLNCIGKVTAKLRCPRINELEIMGNAEVSTYNILKTDTLRITQKSGGKAYLDLDVKYLDVQLSEGGLLTAEGYANTQAVSVTTNATFSAFDLEGEVIDIQTSLGGIGKVCASEKLKALSKMGGYISYKCDPAMVEIEKKGNGVVEKLPE